MSGYEIKLQVNGKDETLDVKGNETLLRALRRIGYVEVKLSCEGGDCGACAYFTRWRGGERLPHVRLLRRMAPRSPPYAALEPKTTSTRFRSRLSKKEVCSAGFCTPGIVVSAKALLDENPAPTREDIQRGLAGNLCRCTGYKKIFEAVESAALQMNEGGDS